ncbi:type I 3-dehydroquinate dehydratase [Brevibacterium linens]|uniref:3-dehydroquinate dehydratase n=1 Tax=Brevibacterium linens ATCC 9172 TaxID=1255617 RepID=A0A2H1IRB0_BRELN|nr:type I 3-dehydroquinate dehydratase [Brevibacterium linens]KAB1948873.1 type I 3-dehydroquinate dehydratase [Brevibacterium linens ATCC 9172]SMX77769.1 3-dehydroquinate dehydratase [Brevibacterium linens ATCC 9172]
MKSLPFLNPAAGSPAVRNPDRPAIIVPTQALDAEDLAAECAAAAATGIVDAVEWRIDLLLAAASGSAQGGAHSGVHGLAEAALRLLPHALTAGLPILLTVRTGFEGGQVEITEDAYAEVVRELIAGVADVEAGAGTAAGAGPSGTGGTGTAASGVPGSASWGVPVAIDVEIDRAESGSLIASARQAGVPVVASHHNFESTDSAERLLKTFAAMSEAGADVAKVAMMPQAPADVLRLLEATAAADASLPVPVLGIAMGLLGRTSRIMGAGFGSCATFAQIGRASAPGQIEASVLAEILDRVGGRCV